jgi:hypothetical protein
MPPTIVSQKNRRAEMPQTLVIASGYACSPLAFSQTGILPSIAPIVAGQDTRLAATALRPLPLPAAYLLPPERSACASRLGF